MPGDGGKPKGEGGAGLRVRESVEDGAFPIGETTLRRLLFDESRDGMATFNVDAKVIDSNRAFSEMLGYSREEMIGKYVWEWDAQWTREEILAMVGRLTTESLIFETRHRRKDGTIRDAEVSANRVDFDGHTVLFCVVRDITDRNRVARELRHEAGLRRMMFEQSRDAICILHQDGSVYAANPAFCRLLGYSAEEMRDLHFGDWEAGLSREAVLALMQTPPQGGGTFDTVHRRKDGSLCDVELTVNALEFEGNILHFCVHRDITARKQAEMERIAFEKHLHESQKLESLGVLAGGVAHDFNNILTIILGYAEIAREDLAPTSPVRNALRQIEAAARRAAELCSQMLAYSGKGQFVIESVSLGSLARDMIDLLGASISKKSAIQLIVADEVPIIRGDAGQMRQVLLNLVLNASDAYGDSGGVITVSIGSMYCPRAYLDGMTLNTEAAEGDYAFCEVSDTGCGMDAKTLKRMFEPFFTTKFAGRGLGMSAIMGIVRGHRGAMKVWTEPGQGTTVRVLLPVQEAVVSTTDTLSDVRPAKAAAERRCVLLMDDEEEVRGLGKIMLEQLGYSVLSAADGFEGVEIFEREHEKIAFVLLDFSMPRMDGIEAFQRLTAIDPEVVVVVSSGYTEKDVTARFAGKTIAGFIQKPYTSAMLQKRIESILEER